MAAEQARDEALEQRWAFIARLWMETSDAVRRARQDRELSQVVSNLALTVVAMRYQEAGPDALDADLPILARFVEQHRQNHWSPEDFVLGRDTGLNALEAVAIHAQQDLAQSRPGIELIVLDRFLHGLIDLGLTKFVIPSTIDVDTAIRIAERSLWSGEAQAVP